MRLSTSTPSRPGHHDVEQNKIEMAGADQFQRTLTGFSLGDKKSLASQPAGQYRAIICDVVNDQERGLIVHLPMSLV